MRKTKRGYQLFSLINRITLTVLLIGAVSGCSLDFRDLTETDGLGSGGGGGGGGSNGSNLDQLIYGFGPHVVASTTTTRTFFITNDTVADFTGCSAPVLSGADAGDFTLIDVDCGANDLLVGTSCSFTLSATPTVAGLRAATVSRVCTTGGTLASQINGISVYATGACGAAAAKDTGFNGTGEIFSQLSAVDSDFPLAAGMQTDGKTVVVRGLWDASSHITAVRYNNDGTTDGSFGTYTFSDLGTNGGIRKVLVQPDGRILMAGGAGDSSWASKNLAVYRFDDDGTLDTSFGSSGRFLTSTTSTAGFSDEAFDVALQSDGKIVVLFEDDSTNGSFGVLRLLSDGTLDTTFGTAGLTVADFGPDRDFPTGIEVDSQDRIVVIGGESYNGAGPDFGIARFTANGTLDTAFSGNGMQTVSIFGGGGYQESADGFQILPDDSILIVGRTYNGANNIYGFAKLDSTGSLDTGFSGDGINTLNVVEINGTANIDAGAIHVASDGSIYLIGSGYAPGLDGWEFMAKVLSSGAVDTTFGTSGYALTHFSLTTGGMTSNSPIVRPDGRVIHFGSGLNSGQWDGGLMRLCVPE